MPRNLLLVLLALLMAGLASAQSRPPAQAQTQIPTPADPWSRLEFLVGDWTGVGTGAPGEGTGGTVFAFELGGKILVRKNWAKYPPKPGESVGPSHEDLMIIYPAAGAFRAVYFDNEGHVINYSVSFPGQANAAVLETEAGQPGPRYRLTYELAASGALENVFWIAPPGGDFKAYVQGTLKKK